MKDNVSKFVGAFLTACVLVGICSIAGAAAIAALKVLINVIFG